MSKPNAITSAGSALASAAPPAIFDVSRDHARRRRGGKVQSSG
jgi:hypothetical protein